MILPKAGLQSLAWAWGQKWRLLPPAHLDAGIHELRCSCRNRKSHGEQTPSICTQTASLNTGSSRWLYYGCCDPTQQGVSWPAFRHQGLERWFSKVQPGLELLSCWAPQHQVVHIWMGKRSRGQIPFWDSVDGRITNRKIHTDLLFWDSADECQSLTSWIGLSSPFREMWVGRKETKSVLNDILEWERHELPAVQKGNIAQGGHLGLRVHWAFLHPT